MALVKTEHFTNTNDILIAPELAFAIPCIVGNAGVTAGADGKKIIKAGTPLYGSADVFMNRQTVLTISSTGTTIYGLARHDIDVTAGNANDTLLVAGYVDYLKLDEDVQALVTAAKASLPRILVLKGAGK